MVNRCKKVAINAVVLQQQAEERVIVKRWSSQKERSSKAETAINSTKKA
jgi:hypothetical protein